MLIPINILFCVYASPLPQQPRIKALPAEHTSHGSRSDTCPRRSWYTHRYGRSGRPHTDCTPNQHHNAYFITSFMECDRHVLKHPPTIISHSLLQFSVTGLKTPLIIVHNYEHSNCRRVRATSLKRRGYNGKSQSLSSAWWFCVRSWAWTFRSTSTFIT